MNLLKSLSHKKIIFYLLIFFLFLINFITINNFIMDNYWNYGFSYNIATGMIPYRDFNMLQFPLSTLILSFIMKIFSHKLIIYYFYSSFLLTSIFYFIFKMHGENALFGILYFLLFFGGGGYNALSLLLFLIILYLEEKKSSDYTIGLVLGLAILTKQYLAVLIIPTLLSRDWPKIWCRFKSAIIPVQLLLFYLVFNNALTDFLDCTILGILDFGNKNANMTIWLFADVILIILLIYLYSRTKEQKWLYVLCFQIMAVPLFDAYHFLLAFIPVFILLSTHGKKAFKMVNVLFIIATIFMFVNNARDMLNYFKNMNFDRASNYYLTSESEYLNEISSIYEKYQNYPREVHFISSNAYYYKLKNNMKIDKFDLILYGNNGYDGNEKIQKRIEQIDDAIFVVEDVKQLNKYDQTNTKIVDFIKKNYNKIGDLGHNFYLYEVVN